MAPQVTTIPEVADEAEVMREQLDYLIDEVASHVGCNCSECQRYFRVRSILLEIFGEPRHAQVLGLTQELAKAA